MSWRISTCSIYLQEVAIAIRTDVTTGPCLWTRLITKRIKNRPRPCARVQYALAERSVPEWGTETGGPTEMIDRACTAIGSDAAHGDEWHRDRPGYHFSIGGMIYRHILTACTSEVRADRSLRVSSFKIPDSIFGIKSLFLWLRINISLSAVSAS